MITGLLVGVGFFIGFTLLTVVCYLTGCLGKQREITLNFGHESQGVYYIEDDGSFPNTYNYNFDRRNRRADGSPSSGRYNINPMSQSGRVSPSSAPPPYDSQFSTIDMELPTYEECVAKGYK